MKIGRFTDAAKEMVNELFKIEAEGSYHESKQMGLSVKVMVTTGSMLNVIADTFGQSRFAFSGEILDDFIVDLFLSLPEKMRVSLSEKADSLTTEMLNKQGIKIGLDGKGEDETWRSLALLPAQFKTIEVE